VIVLTDGEVTNTDAVLALGRAHAADARIFTFGIGAGASHHLVKGLARAAGGAAEFIVPGERVEPKVIRQFARLLSPAVTDVHIEWLGGTVRPAPSVVPPVFAGDRLVAYGFVEGGSPSAVRLTGRTQSGPITFEVPLGAPGAGGTVAPLAARARIRELEEGAEWLSSRGSQQRERKAGAARDEIISLSVRYGLLSRETSYVAIERRDTPVVGDVQLRKVPIALTSGWGGLQDRVLRTAGLRPAAPRWAAELSEVAYSRVHIDAAHARASMHTLDMPQRLESLRQALRVEEGFIAKRKRSKPAQDPLYALVALQDADGSWPLTRELAESLGRPHSELLANMPAVGCDPEPRQRAWATALALAWLDEHFREAVEEWRLLADKGMRWLENTLGTERDAFSWLESARQLLVHP
jgi:Ca-activated chloride channel family protein